MMKSLSQRILLVDADQALCELLTRFLGDAGYRVSVLHRAAQLPVDIRSAEPDLVVMERRFPDLDGFTALKQLRGHGDATPVIVMSSLADAIDRVIGLELGADDYLAKPFVPSELLARIRAVLRRTQAGVQADSPITSGYAQHKQPDVCFGPYRVVYASRTVLRDGVPQCLTESQFALLAVFAQRPMMTLSRSRLTALLQGGIRESSVNVAIARLREMLPGDPAHPHWIRTVRGEGYRFVPDPAHVSAGVESSVDMDS
ncbi:MAG TPA: response regulator transcription factor [Paraburkholderia sp.]|jgi:two-component system phosphate regulon response regulator OmpR|uniref:response regulator transcription factor n=1 Tax=Paraburkholderia sp. TaxID=1926495 RepID=UPI002DE1F82A|nr:response regulator transcription factor [Paraburkholderia sp.]